MRVTYYKTNERELFGSGQGPLLLPHQDGLSAPRPVSAAAWSSSPSATPVLRTEKLPEGVDKQYELKLDRYGALAVKSGGKVQLRSRNNNDFSTRYPEIVKALASMPDDTVIDCEVVARLLNAKSRSTAFIKRAAFKTSRLRFSRRPGYTA